MEKERRMRKTLLLAGKIAVGSSTAIYIAQKLGLEYAISAGTITLLTLMTTKWEKVKQSAFRLVTFVVTILTARIALGHINSAWIGYGIFIFCVVLFSGLLGWRATVSVNSVIGAHLLTSHDFSMASVKNEFLLVLIGIMIALILNLFYDNHQHKQDIISNMRYTENQLQRILCRFAEYLSQEEAHAGGSVSSENTLQNGRPSSGNVWDDIIKLEKELQNFIKEAYEYQDNTFHSHPVYYIDYCNCSERQTTDPSATQIIRCLRSFCLRLLGVPPNSSMKNQPLASKLAQSVFSYCCRSE